MNAFAILMCRVMPLAHVIGALFYNFMIVLELF